jgi:hypothetical protein
MALTVKILWTFMTLRTARNYLHTGLVLELLKPRETKYKPIRGNDTYGLILCLTRCKAQKFTRDKRLGNLCSILLEPCTCTSTGTRVTGFKHNLCQFFWVFKNTITR